MNLHTQIKTCRAAMRLTQEELADRVYVTRQTVSNWENDKSYPDIQSLLLLSTLFGISLDQLVKGDIAVMKKEISKEMLQKFNRLGLLFTLMLALLILSAVPLTVFLGLSGLLVTVALFSVTLCVALKIVKIKKAQDVQTFREIVAFTEGKPLDEMAKNREYGKRPYQKVFFVFLCAAVTVLVCLFFLWLLKAFIFPA